MPNFDLVEKAPQVNNYLLVLTMLALTLVAYARTINPKALSLVWRRFWKLNRIESFGFDDDKIRPQTQWLLIANFLIALGLSTYLFFLDHLIQRSAPLLSTIVVLGYVFFQMVNYRGALLFANQWKLVPHLAEVNKQVWSFSGLLLLVLTFLWVINRSDLTGFYWAYLLILFGTHLWRWIKAWRTCLQVNLEWYYLILYLCTLEITPLLFVWRWFAGGTEIN